MKGNQHATHSRTKPSKEVLYPGLDVHPENIAVAIAEAGRDGEVRNHGVIPNTLLSIEKLLRKLGHPGKELRVCDEAGPCGFDSVASFGFLTLPLLFRATPSSLSVSRLPPPLGCPRTTPEEARHRMRRRRPPSLTAG